MRKETWLSLVLGNILLLLCLSKPTLCEMASSSNNTNTKAERPECLQKLMDCFEEHADNESNNPMYDEDSPEFDQKEYVCCPLMQQTLLGVPKEECLCSSPANPFFFFLLDEVLLGSLPKNETDNVNSTRLLKLCNIIDDSVPSLADFCKDSSSFQELSAPADTNTTANISHGRKLYSTFTTFITILVCLAYPFHVMFKI